MSENLNTHPGALPERSENPQNGQKKGKSLPKRVVAVIAMGAAAVLLICGYFFVLRPMLTEQEVETHPIDRIWEDEVVMGDNSLLLIPHYYTDDVQEIAVHNPGNAPSYVDWGFFYNEKEDAQRGLDADQFYMTDYTYASFEKETLSHIITAAGYVICSTRLEDHCTDFAKYGLDTQTGDYSDRVYYTLTLRDGTKHTVLVGSKTPTGSSYYVRSLDESVDLSTGEKTVRDSVYILSSVFFKDTIMSTPMALATPYLGYPVDDTKPLELFALYINEKKYYYPNEEGGEDVWQPAIYARALKKSGKDPFSIFTGTSLYSMQIPAGYYSSYQMERTITVFGDFQGESILEMAKDRIDEDGTLTAEDFDEETLKKYSLDQPYYQLAYVSSAEDISLPSVVYFSKLQENSYYYAYSLNFNSICKVDKNTVYFLNWDVDSFVSNYLSFTNIENIQSMNFKGSYYDLGVEQDYRKGNVDVDLNYRLDGKGQELIVTETNTGKTVDTTIFRKVYESFLQTGIRKAMTEQEIEETMKKDPYFTLTLVTKETVVYKTDEKGNATTEVDYIRPSVMRILRYYEISEGRSLVTTEDIDQNGRSLGENGSFYAMSATAYKLMAHAVDLYHGVPIDKTLHG